MPEDAEFVMELRLDERRNRYLSPIDHDLEKQRKWIEAYKQREHAGREYYFVIQDSDRTDIGLVRLYDFRDDSFSWGSWLLSPDAPTYAAIESALLVYEFAFHATGFNRSHFEVLKGNTKVLQFHTRFGATIAGEDERAYYLEYTKEGYQLTRRRYMRFLTPSKEPSPLVQLATIADPRGNLIVAELAKQLPFVVKRIFMINDVPNGQMRGEHAHKKCHQFLIATTGSVNVVLDDGTARREYVLSDPSIGLHIQPGIWGIQYKYTEQAVLLVLASHEYDPSDYIRDYDAFLQWKKEQS